MKSSTNKSTLSRRVIQTSNVPCHVSSTSLIFPPQSAYARGTLEKGDLNRGLSIVMALRGKGGERKLRPIALIALQSTQWLGNDPCLQCRCSGILTCVFFAEPLLAVVRGSLEKAPTPPAPGYSPNRAV